MKSFFLTGTFSSPCWTRARAVEDEVDLFLGRIADRRARAAGVHDHLAKPRDAAQLTRVGVAGAEDRLVAARRGGEVGRLWFYVGQVLAEKGGIDLALLGQTRAGRQYRQ